MVFVVAVDPDCISACLAQGDLGEDLIVGVFEALLQNCLVAEISVSWRVSQTLKEVLQALPDGSVRKRVGAIVEALASPANCRFVEVIRGYENDYETPVGEILSSQETNGDVDAVITAASPPPSSVKSVKVTEFNRSNFGRERSRLASSSLVFAPRQKQAGALLKEAFLRVVQHTDKVEIFDRQMGISMGGNYHDAIEHWCSFFTGLESDFHLHVHTTANQAAAVKRKFAEHLDGSKVRLSVHAHAELDQPHDRFLRSCGFTFDIGRGVDLFDRDGGCRDVKIGLSDHGGFTKQWRQLADSPAI